HRQPRVQAHAAGDHGMDRRAQRRARSAGGALMEIRALVPGDREAMERFFSRVPKGDRTFFKEDVDDPDVVARWVGPGAGRSIAVHGDAIFGSVALVQLTGWSSHVAEGRVVVDPAQRGRGVGRDLARPAVLEA